MHIVQMSTAVVKVYTAAYSAYYISARAWIIRLGPFEQHKTRIKECSQIL